MTIRSTEILLWFFWSKLAGTWIMSIRLAVRYAIFMPFLWLFLAVFWISWLRQEKLAVAKMEEEERMRRGCWVKRLVWLREFGVRKGGTESPTESNFDIILRYTHAKWFVNGRFFSLAMVNQPPFIHGPFPTRRVQKNWISVHFISKSGYLLAFLSAFSC